MIQRALSGAFLKEGKNKGLILFNSLVWFLGNKVRWTIEIPSSFSRLINVVIWFIFLQSWLTDWYAVICSHPAPQSEAGLSRQS